MKAIIAALFLTVTTGTLAEEVDLFRTNDARATYDDASLKRTDGIAFGIVYWYQASGRLVYLYGVNGCAKGYGTVSYATNRDDMKTYYWTANGQTNGDEIARTICSRAP